MGASCGWPGDAAQLGRVGAARLQVATPGVVIGGEIRGVRRVAADSLAESPKCLCNGVCAREYVYL